MIEKIVFGLSSALFIEGLILALLPRRFKNIFKVIEKISPATLSVFGLIMMGIALIFLSVIEI